MARSGKKTKNAPEFIHQYVKKNIKGRKQIVGILVGRMDENKQLHFGWSKTNISTGDIFDRKVGMDIAMERTKATKCVPIPLSMIEDAMKFDKRCSRYFQDAIYTGEMRFQTKNIHEQMDDLLAD